MPPKTAPAKTTPVKTKPAKTKSAKASPSAGKGKEKGKGKGKGKPKRHRLNLKGFLKTAADWARFDAWAKTNALPRKVPEPEPIVRVAKPIGQLKKRILVIALPHIYPDISKLCRTDLNVSKAALKAKASKRTKKLAMFILKITDCGRESPIPITKAALMYKPSARIIEISQAKLVEPEPCNDLEISKNALKHKTSAREKKMALARKAEACPNSLTDEEKDKLMTDTGIMKKALTYEITEWMLTLALPSFRFLRDRKDSDAKEWKKQLSLEAISERGKKALEEKQERERNEEEKRTGKKRKPKDEKDKKDKKGGEGGAKEGEDGKKDDEDQGEGDKKDKKKKEGEFDWRKQPSPCKADPFKVSKAATKATASARTKEISKPHIHKSKSCKNDPFKVKKGALNASASARTEEMAKPNRPRDPVERPPPREKDKYGAPIFPKPKYGKVMPKVKAYKMGKCKDKNEEKKSAKKKKKIDPIPLFPTIDPCLDPVGAKRQAKARKAAKEAKKKRRAERKEAAQKAKEADASADNKQQEREQDKQEEEKKEEGEN